jgi:hypothetical protein
MRSLLAAIACLALGTTVAPGTTLFTSTAQSCNDATLNASNTTYCLTPGGYPTTLCRVPDPSCATDRVAASLQTTSQEHNNCSTFTWTWACSTLTDSPTLAPTATPTASPTSAPTTQPTAVPTNLPTAAPTEVPTSTPTPQTLFPTIAFPTPSPHRTPVWGPTPLQPRYSTPTPAPTQTEGSKDQQEDEGWAWWIWLLVAIAGLLGVVCLMVLVVGCLMCCGGSGELARVTPEPAGGPASANTDRVVHNNIYEQDGVAETSI